MHITIVSTETPRERREAFRIGRIKRSRKCNENRRQITRYRKNGGDISILNEFSGRLKDSRRELNKMIRLAKRVKWKELCDMFEEDVQGGGYKLVMKSMKLTIPFKLHSDVKKEAVLKLFPRGEDWGEKGENKPVRCQHSPSKS